MISKYLLTLAAMLPIALAAQTQLDWEAGVTVNAGGDSQLAPYYISSNRGGTVTQQYSTLFNAGISHKMDTTTRLSWGAGVELWGGWASSATYGLLPPPGWASAAMRDEHPARAWVQQAWLEGKYRGVFLTLGAKHSGSPLLNDRLSSGDLIHSANARPMVGASAGFVNFQSVPFTRGWLQIKGEVGYFKPADNKWLENHYNYYNHLLTTGWWLNYKNIYFRSNPNKPFVVTLGLQAACQFGGTTVTYSGGNEMECVEQKADAEAFFKSLIPMSGGTRKGDKAFFAGNHLGSWDIMLSYRLPAGSKVKAYYQSPWEDGSSLGKRNGFDGLWGLEYESATPSWLSGAVIEYIDMTNQCGPIHWAPADHDGTTLTTKVTGMDDYYNNYAYNGYHNRGMSLGSPMLRSPLYNQDGHLRFDHNVVRGVHAAIAGHITHEWQYRAMGSWRKSWGSMVQPITPALTATSLMVEAVYKPASVAGLQCTAQLALDRGKLYGNNFGALLAITYHGNFTLGKR